MLRVHQNHAGATTRYHRNIRVSPLIHWPHTGDTLEIALTARPPILEGNVLYFIERPRGGKLFPAAAGSAVAGTADCVIFAPGPTLSSPTAPTRNACNIRLRTTQGRRKLHHSVQYSLWIFRQSANQFMIEKLRKRERKKKTEKASTIIIRAY